MSASQGTTFGPHVTPQTFELLRDDQALASGRNEYEDGARFFGHFQGALGYGDLRDQVVLDLGCGYGGRTVFYARDCGARQVEGIEISARMVERCEHFAAEMNVANVAFRIAFAEDLPFPEGQFDTVVSYDVLEHVSDPRIALSEISRVLKPGGTAWLVFPTYRGAWASHLDYLTRVPALHRIFDPDVIVEVVNELLTRDPQRYGVEPQPPPKLSALGKLVLPTLNGLTLGIARQAVIDTGLQLTRERLIPVIHPESQRFGGRAISAVMSSWQRHLGWPELLIGNIAFEAHKLGTTACHPHRATDDTSMPRSAAVK